MKTRLIVSVGRLWIICAMSLLTSPASGAVALQAGDANMDLQIDLFDFIQVLSFAKYLTGQPATWLEGDWDGAPGGEPGSPPPGDGFFNELDIISVLNNGLYHSGPYGNLTPPSLSGAKLLPGGSIGDTQISVVYNELTGEIALDVPNGMTLSSFWLESYSRIFSNDPAENLGGAFDNDWDGGIFKALLGTSFTSLSFGNVADPGQSEAFLLGDFYAIGTLSQGGPITDVDFVYLVIPAPGAFLLSSIGVVVVSWLRRRRTI